MPECSHHPGEAKDLAARLTGRLADAVRPGRKRTQTSGVAEFCRRVAEATGATPETAQWDVSAVLSTPLEAVSGVSSTRSSAGCPPVAPSCSANGRVSEAVIQFRRPRTPAAAGSPWPP
ncbi:DUF2267 domain-containing protein [Nonomuraea terrae]|uniref:DUF2267 domain-containing protein n=1 Tax=Nonomuraea terrae TaxID=2530383 RepID=A0A4R4YJI4_9ACTN|nr:DUF2267 domain-containing protein [Nonomuraea terrae]